MGEAAPVWLEEDETTVIPQFPEIPEDVDEAQAGALITVYEQTIATLPPIGQQTLDAYADCVETLKLAAKRMDDIRSAKKRPHLDAANKIQEAYKPFVDKLTELHKRLAVIPNQWIAQEQARIASEQAAANAKAEADRKAKEAEAERLRLEADKAREQGDEQTAAKLEGKADVVEVKAAAIVPQTVQQVSAKVATAGGGSVSFGGGVKFWDLNGWAKDAKGDRKPLPCMDPLLKDLREGWEHCPPGIQFLLRMSKLDPTLLNAAYKLKEVFPRPFTEGTDYSKSARR